MPFPLERFPPLAGLEPGIPIALIVIIKFGFPNLIFI